MKNMLCKLQSIILLLMLSGSANATTIKELQIPILLSNSPIMVDKACLNNSQCLKNISKAKNILTHTYHAFNQLLYSEDNTAALKFVSPKFKALLGQKAQKFRQKAVGDAEQIYSFGVQNFESSSDGKNIRLDVYVLFFTEGSLFLSEAQVTFTFSNFNNKLEIENYEVFRK